MVSTFDRVLVVGLGTIGVQLAVQLAASGYRVVGVDRNVAGAHCRVRALASDRRELLHPPGSAAEQRYGWIDLASDLDLVQPVDLVIEALPERLDLKVDVLRKADRLCRPETVIVTTTMGLSVTEIAARCGRMTRTVGMQLGDVAGTSSDVVELISTPVTDAAVLDSLHAFARSLGQQVVAASDQPGPIGTALSLRYLNRAVAMLEEGYASRDDIDTAMTLGCGLPIGPLAQLDLIGLDAVVDSMTALAERTGDASLAPVPTLTRMREAGLLGQKSGRGFYSYDTSAKREPLPPLSDPPRSVSKVGVIGAGTMATGIAETFAAGGFPTVLVARTDLRAKQARSTIESSLERRARKGRLSTVDLEAITDRLSFESEMDILGDCDLVVEAVVEDIQVKRGVFGHLDRLARPGAVLATTTSSLPVIECATATGRPWDVIGMRFLNPAPAMKLVEVVHTFLTAKDVVATSAALVTALGKQVVRCGDRTGFIVNALLLPYLNDAAAAAKSRHLPTADVDRLMTGRHGYPMGPFHLLDMIGLDVSVSILESLDAAFPSAGHAPAEYLTNLVAGGCLGRKSGRGFYAYDTP